MIVASRPVAEVTAAGSAVASVVVAAQPTVLGIGSALLLACLAGSLFGLAHTRPEAWGRLLDIPQGSPGRRFGWLLLRAGGLLFTVCAVALFVGWAVSVIPHVPGFQWLRDVPPVPLGGVFAYGGQRWIPRVLGTVDKLIERRGEP